MVDSDYSTDDDVNESILNKSVEPEAEDKEKVKEEKVVPETESNIEKETEKEVEKADSGVDQPTTASNVSTEDASDYTFTNAVLVKGFFILNIFSTLD